MRIKGFALLGLCVMLTALPACDNVEWGGMELGIRVPERAPEPEPQAEDGDEEEVLRPLPLGPMVYLAERVGGDRATLVPLALWASGDYGDLPTFEDTPELEERFPLGRWEEGTEFILLGGGGRAGTLLTDGSVGRADERCLARPRTGGTVELHPEVAGARAFLAVRREDVEGQAFAGGVPRRHPAGVPAGGEQLRPTAEALGRWVVPRAEIPWPPSIPGILRDWAVGSLQDGEAAVGASFVFGGELEPGSLTGSGYSFFTLATRDEDGTWVPEWLWYQPSGAPRTSPLLLAAGSLRGEAADVVLEVVGEEDRWIQLLADRGDGLEPVYRDPCGIDAPAGTARPWP